MSTMTYLDTAPTCLAASAVHSGCTVFAIYGNAWQGPVRNFADACVDFFPHKNFTTERVGKSIRQADLLWVQDRNGAKELAIAERFAEDADSLAAYVCDEIHGDWRADFQESEPGKYRGFGVTRLPFGF